MNVNKPPFDDIQVRRAFNYAIDKEEIARMHLSGAVVPAKGILPPGFPGYDPTIHGYEYNPEKARQLLRESKYGDNLEDFPRIVLTTPGDEGLDTRVIRDMWHQNLGIEVEHQSTEWAVFLKDPDHRRFQMFKLGDIADYPDPEFYLDLIFHSESSYNNTGYSNPEVDHLPVRARVGSLEERYELYHQIERMILEDAPWVPLWNPGERYFLVKPNVKG